MSQSVVHVCTFLRQIYLANCKSSSTNTAVRMTYESGNCENLIKPAHNLIKPVCDHFQSPYAQAGRSVSLAVHLKDRNTCDLIAEGGAS